MLGNKKIEMMHFPSRLNMGISAISFKSEEIDDVRWGGYAILENYLNDAIFMTGKYCYEYAEKVGCNEKILRLIGDTWGNYTDEKKQFLKPKFELSYTELNSFFFRDCINISFPSVSMNTSSCEPTQDSLENLSDLVLKASIKSLVNIKNEEIFSLNIFRVNNENLFQSYPFDEPHHCYEATAV